MKKTVLRASAGIILGILMLFVWSFSAFAMPELLGGSPGSIEIIMRLPVSKEPVPGILFSLYKVGTAEYSSAGLQFKPNAGYPDATLSAEELAVAEKAKLVARQFYSFIEQNSIAPDGTLVTGEDGKVVFENRPVGLYLIVAKYTDGMPCTLPEPFVMGIPAVDKEAGDWDYSVTAIPKIEEIPEETTSYDSVTGDEDLDSGSGEKDDTLPQTGLYRWPIPYLSAGGILMFSFGWTDVWLGRKKKKDED